MPRRLILLLVVSCSVVIAQTGLPETSLAGINLHQMRIADVQRLYGQQEAVYAVPPGRYPAGTKLYKWGRLTLTLKVLTEPLPTGEAIRAVEIQGEGEPGDKAINRSGRGLKLSSKSSEVKKLYGVDAIDGSTVIKWSDGTTLVVGFNDKHRVNKLELQAPPAQ